MIVDPHVHVLRKKNFDKATLDRLRLPVPEDTKLDTLVGWLKGAGVDKAVIMGQDMSRIWNSCCGEDYVRECAGRYPDFFVPLASVEPIDAAGRFNEPALEYFEKAVRQYGFQGLLLTPPYGHYRSDDCAVYPFYQKAVELNVVVQFHHCPQSPGPLVLTPFKYVTPMSLHNFLEDFPDLKVVIEHLNYPYYEELFMIMSADPNVYADISMNYHRPYLLTWNLVKAKEFGVIDRIMYASDYWAPGKDQTVFSTDPGKDMKEWIQFVRTGLNGIAEKCGWPTFSQEEIDGILGGNAARLYGLSKDA